MVRRGVLTTEVNDLSLPATWPGLRAIAGGFTDVETETVPSAPTLRRAFRSPAGDLPSPLLTASNRR